MKNKILVILKKLFTVPIIAIVILFVIMILRMYFTTAPRPPVIELLGMIFLGGLVVLSLCHTVYWFFKSIFTVFDSNITLKDRHHKENIAKKQPIITPDDEFVIRINTKIVGVTYDCDFVRYTNRQDWLENLSYSSDKWNEVYLHYYKYNGESAFHVVYDKYDLGNLKRELSLSIMEKYPNCKYKVEILGITGGGKRSFGCNIAIDVYRSLKENEEG